MKIYKYIQYVKGKNFIYEFRRGTTPTPDHKLNLSSIELYFIKTTCLSLLFFVRFKRMKDKAKLHGRKDLREKNKVMATLYIFSCENYHIPMNSGLSEFNNATCINRAS